MRLRPDVEARRRSEQARVLLRLLADRGGDVVTMTNADLVDALADTAERLRVRYWWCRSPGPLLRAVAAELLAAGWTAEPWHDGRARGWTFTRTPRPDA